MKSSNLKFQPYESSDKTTSTASMFDTILNATAFLDIVKP